MNNDLSLRVDGALASAVRHSIDRLAICQRTLCEFEHTVWERDAGRSRSEMRFTPGAVRAALQVSREKGEHERSARIEKAAERAHLRDDVRAYATDLKIRLVAPERMLVGVKDIVREGADHAGPMIESRQIVSDAVQWALDVYYPPS